MGNLADRAAHPAGGDVCDKGGETGGSVRVTTSLVRLKCKYPDRVFLLLGNRDLNKMRFTSELAAEQMALLPEVCRHRRRRDHRNHRNPRNHPDILCVP